MKTSEYLDLIKKINELKKDIDVAKALKLTRSSVHVYRKNSAQFGPDTCLKVAKLTGIPGERIAADMMAARAKDRKTREAWEKLGAKVAPPRPRCPRCN